MKSKKTHGKSDRKQEEFKVGDLVEYTGNFVYTKRPKFGIVFHVKKLIKYYELGILFGVQSVYMSSKYLEKR
jgi:hypothetical protein